MPRALEVSQKSLVISKQYKTSALALLSGFGCVVECVFGCVFICIFMLLSLCLVVLLSVWLWQGP